MHKSLSINRLRGPSRKPLYINSLELAALVFNLTGKGFFADYNPRRGVEIVGFSH